MGLGKNYAAQMPLWAKAKSIPNYLLVFYRVTKTIFSERNAYISFNFEVTQKSLNMGRFDNYTFYLSKLIFFSEKWQILLEE